MSQVIETLPKVIKIIYLILLAIITIYWLFKSLDEFKKIYIFPSKNMLENLKKLESYYKTLLNYKKILNKDKS